MVINTYVIVNELYDYTGQIESSLLRDVGIKFIEPRSAFWLFFQ